MLEHPEREPEDLLAVAQTALDGAVPRVELHAHTTWTDGSDSVAEMYERAVAETIELINFSEHARHTSIEWFPAFAEEVRSLPASPCRALVGTEVKVLDLEGAVDADDALLDLYDLVMASVHRFPGEADADAGTRNRPASEAVDTEFRLMCAVLNNPAVDILGHPFGMCYRRFDVAPPDDLIRELIADVAASSCAFEINARYHPHPRRLIEWCREAGARISLGSNAHSIEDVGRIVRILEGTESPWNPSASS